MTVHELTRPQIIELKQSYLMQLYETGEESPSMGELSDADNIISDETIINHWEGVSFTADDFFCTATI